MPCRMAEVLPETGLVDDVVRGLVQIGQLHTRLDFVDHSLLRFHHDPMNLAQLRRDFTQKKGARQVGVVAGRASAAATTVGCSTATARSWRPRASRPTAR